MSGETIPDDIRAAAAHALQADSYHPELVFLIEPVALVILAERERCAELLVRADGYFNAPPGLYEALSCNTTADGDSGLWRSGDTGNWAAFFYEMLKPFAAAIRKGEAR